MQITFCQEYFRRKCAPFFIVRWVCIVLSLFFSVSTESLAAQNLLVNGDFELGEVKNPLEHWLSESYQQGAVIERTSERTYQGKYALKIYSPDPNDTRAIQTVAVKPDTFYRLSGYCWTEGIAPTDKIGANLCIMLPDYYYSEPAWTGTTGAWRRTEFVFKTAAKESEITIGVRLGMWNNTVSGAVFFDNIRLEELASTPVFFKQIKIMDAQIHSVESVPREKSEKHSEYWLWIIPLTMMVVIFVIYLDLKKD